MFKSTSKNPFQCLPPLDDESHHLSVLSLKCLAQLLSWIPLSSYITSQLLTTVFHFASFGCHPEPVSIDVCLTAGPSCFSSSTPLTPFRFPLHAVDTLPLARLIVFFGAQPRTCIFKLINSLHSL